MIMIIIKIELTALRFYMYFSALHYYKSLMALKLYFLQLHGLG